MLAMTFIFSASHLLKRCFLTKDHISHHRSYSILSQKCSISQSDNLFQNESNNLQKRPFSSETFAYYLSAQNPPIGMSHYNN